MAVNIFDWLKERFIKDPRYSRLRSFPILESLGNHDLKLVYDSLHRREFKAGETIFEQGFPLEVIYLITEGQVQVSGLFCGEGPRTFQENESVGLIDLFGRGNRVSSAKAMTDVKVQAFAAKDFWELVEKKPSLGVKLLKACCMKLGAFITDTVKDKR